MGRSSVACSLVSVAGERVAVLRNLHAGFGVCGSPQRQQEARLCTDLV